MYVCVYVYIYKNTLMSASAIGVSKDCIKYPACRVLCPLSRLTTVTSIHLLCHGSLHYEPQKSVPIFKMS